METEEREKTEKKRVCVCAYAWRKKKKTRIQHVEKELRVSAQGADVHWKLLASTSDNGEVARHASEEHDRGAATSQLRGQF